MYTYIYTYISLLFKTFCEIPIVVRGRSGIKFLKYESRSRRAVRKLIFAAARVATANPTNSSRHSEFETFVSAILSFGGTQFLAKLPHERYLARVRRE